MTNETWQKTVDAGDVERVEARIRMSSGMLRMVGGAEALFQGVFEYGSPEWQPEVSYESQNGVGRLVVQPPRVDGLRLHDPRYAWDVGLGGGVPMALALELGSGRADLGLGGTRLTELEAKLGSGQLAADLTGDQPLLKAIDLASGSGRLGLVLNGAYDGLKTVDLKNASGVTDVAFGGRYGALERVRLNSASGNVNVGLAGHLPKLGHLSVKVASGSIDLNLLDATWETLDAALDCVAGKALLRFAAGTGVFVRFQSVAGRLEAPGLVKVAGGYATPGYETAASKLNLSMSTVSGKLVLQPSDA